MEINEEVSRCEGFNCGFISNGSQEPGKSFPNTQSSMPNAQFNYDQLFILPDADKRLAVNVSVGNEEFGKT